MKLIINSIIFFLLAAVLDTGAYIIGRMKPSRRITSFFARCLEQLADTIQSFEKRILKEL